MTAQKPKHLHKTDGRPTKMTPTVLKKLEDAYLIGASDREACFYADISHQTLYNYQKRNPKFIDRKEALRLHLNLAARKKLADALTSEKDNGTSDAWRWLEKKDPDLKPTQKIEHTGAILNDRLPMNDKMEDAVKLFNEGLRERTIEEIKAMP